MTFAALFLLLLLPHWRPDRAHAAHCPAAAPPVVKQLLSNSTHDFYPTTIVVSLDGFHPHYINASNCPFMHDMLAHGYAAPYMEPLFPSSTFPNHWTLVTGLYPADHGIVGNTFYDPQLRLRFDNVDPARGLDPRFWEGGEPIWRTAACQGVKSAVHMWPGSEVPTACGHAPLYVDRFNVSELLESKTRRVLKWLDTSDIAQRPELVLTYVPTVDTLGHRFGISGAELIEGIRNVDRFVAHLSDSLAARNLSHIVNLVVLSDHGMAPVSEERMLVIDDVTDARKLAYLDGWPLMGIRPKDGVSVDAVHAQIKCNLEALPHGRGDNFRLYKREELPAEWRFGGANHGHVHKFDYRVAPLWIIPDVGYTVVSLEYLRRRADKPLLAGAHGYNNTEFLMRAIFLAQGPYFSAKLGRTTKVLPFSNVNVYNILCDGLGLVPNANNGSAALSAGFPLSAERVLPETWADHSVFPGLSFEVSHVVENATYDNLWRFPFFGGAVETSAEVSETPAGEIPESPFIGGSQESEVSDVANIKEHQNTDEETDKEHSNSDEEHAPTHTGLFRPLLDILEQGVDYLDKGLEYLGDELEPGVGYLGEGLQSGLDYIEDVFGTITGF
ncbi:Phosphodiest-domain-containing protein [Metschnikowia bicuspidata]|uniref:Phosphodiest-domain-containing protein n=1 Tax=Metschnikowia bicuspidata TaxID=27322 RepID=A0A4V1J3M9_9ASCO|nr:Phosphodiest-domain-containing protein [Metschnikowia bicuspidata]